MFDRDDHITPTARDLMATIVDSLDPAEALAATDLVLLEAATASALRQVFVCGYSAGLIAANRAISAHAAEYLASSTNAAAAEAVK